MRTLLEISASFSIFHWPGQIFDRNHGTPAPPCPMALSQDLGVFPRFLWPVHLHRKRRCAEGPRSQGGRPCLRPHGGRGGQAAPGASGVAGVRALDGSEVRGFQGVLMSKWSNMIKHQGSLIGIWWVNYKHCGFNGMLNRINDQKCHFNIF